MTETQVRENVSRYLAGELSAADLAFVLPDGWELDEAADPHLRDLVLRVIGHLAEHERGDLSVAELRKRLVPYAGLVTSTSYSSTSGAVDLSSPEPAKVFAADTAVEVGPS